MTKQEHAKNSRLEAWKAYKEEILARLRADPMIIYGSIQEAKSESSADGSTGWYSGLCPFHHDSSPSFAFNTEHLGWCCFAGCGKGDVFHFVTIKSGKKFKEALVDLGDQLSIKRPQGTEHIDRPPIDLEVVDLFVQQLYQHEDPGILKYLHEKRGLTDETIKARKIGWSKKSSRYTIPVFDDKGQCWNVRLYDPHAKDSKGKMKNFTAGNFKYGSPARLYGLELLEKEKDSLVMICEGEFDSILATQFGITSLSGTHGCSVFHEEWIEALKGRDVAICYDCDEDGKKAVTNNIIPMFRSRIKSGEIKSLKIVTLPLTGTKADKDITDWVVKRGCESEQLKRMVWDTPVHQYPDAEEPLIREEFQRLNDLAKEPPVRLNSFAEITRSDLIGRRVACEVTICGETSESFSAVEQFKVRFCSDRNAGKCSLCSEPITIPHGARDFIGSCASSDAQVLSMLTRNYCPRGQRPIIEILKKRTVCEFFCHQRVSRISNVAPSENENPGDNPEIDRQWDISRNEELLEKRVYYLSDELVKPGHYYAEGWAIDRPQSQHSSFLIEKLVPQEDDFESFRVPEHLSELQAMKKLSADDILGDLRENVTRVWERDELLLGIILSYLSPRWFLFNKELLRGWICMAIIGDVGTAKTKTFTSIARWLNVGDLFSGLTGSRTGLAYALEQSSTKGWNAKIGRYPANSRKLLMVDEVQTLAHEDLKSITKAMDEGVMNVDRVRSSSYESQTRAIFVGNPRTPIMDDVQFGCQTLQQVFPVMMLRRLDFAILANQFDVKDIDGLHDKMYAPSTGRIVTPEMFRSYVFLMWNIRPNQIIFTPEAIAMCKESGNRLSKQFGYAPNIPLITRYEVDKKLARVSIPMAAFNGSFNDSFTVLTVLPEHVLGVERFFTMVYSAENFDLGMYSGLMKARGEIHDYDHIVEFVEKTEQDEKTHSSHGIQNCFQRLLYTLFISGCDSNGKERKALSRSDIADTVGINKDVLARKIRPLKALNLIASGRNGYHGTPRFSRFMRQYLRDRPNYFDGVNKDSLGAVQ